MIVKRENILSFLRKITILFSLIVMKIKYSLENTNLVHIDFDERLEILKNSESILKFDLI